jgi:hypothetical protein
MNAKADKSQGSVTRDVREDSTAADSNDDRTKQQDPVSRMSVALGSLPRLHLLIACDPRPENRYLANGPKNLLQSHPSEVRLPILQSALGCVFNHDLSLRSLLSHDF